MKEHYKFPLKPLPYSYNALEPYIDSETVFIHHERHLKTYVDNLNKTLENYPSLQKMTLEHMLSNLRSIPGCIRQSVINNGGGVYNHNLYFDSMCSQPCKEANGALKALILKQYGSVENLLLKLKTFALARFGSGWAWLVLCSNGGLKIISTQNQICPVSMGLFPLIALDVWEHAYYIKYQNRREDYINAWQELINWEFIQKRFENFLYINKI